MFKFKYQNDQSPFGLVWLDGISTIVGYSKLNPLYMYILNT